MSATGRPAATKGKWELHFWGAAPPPEDPVTLARLPTFTLAKTRTFRAPCGTLAFCHAHGSDASPFRSRSRGIVVVVTATISSQL